MFGQHEIPLKIEAEGIALSLDREGELLLYRRESPGEEINKSLLAGKKEILIHPVEPLNSPKRLTPYLMIGFEDPLVVEPKASKNVFLTFPVEVGVFLSGSKKLEPLDVVSLVKKKFTLYGTPRGGKICKYWRSSVHPSVPTVSLLHEGVMSLRIKNETDGWATVTRVVLDGYGMKIHFNETMVSVKAQMTIVNKVVAETEFVGSPLEKGMAKSLETFMPGMASMMSMRFVMSEGI